MKTQQKYCTGTEWMIIDAETIYSAIQFKER